MTDEEIVLRTFADKEHFALLVERYEPKLLRYLSRIGVMVREDREDILQNVFIKAYRNLASFDPSLTFSSWIYRITHNEAMSFFRMKKARPQLVLDQEGEERIQTIVDETSDAASTAEHRLSKEELEKALTVLPERYREVLLLRFFEERSYTEMSDILQLPIGTISTLVHRAKTELRKALPNNFSL